VSEHKYISTKEKSNTFSSFILSLFQLRAGFFCFILKKKEKNNNNRKIKILLYVCVEHIIS
jgi:hypothetical protein